jgi:putative ABC transport system substrate-binding protein
MRRRQFLGVVVGGAAAAWPVAAMGQQLRHIGVLMALYESTDREAAASAKALADTLQRLGWTEGKNIRIDYRWPGGDPARIKASAAELANSRPDLFVASATRRSLNCTI